MPDADPRRQYELRNPQGFATTRWSVVLAAGKPGDVSAREALSRLCETYWMPLYAYVRRRVGDPATAQDLTQAFFTELLVKNYVGNATPKRGRFRAYLLTAFKHFLSKQWEKERAQKRGGGRSPLSLDFAAADSALAILGAFAVAVSVFYVIGWKSCSSPKRARRCPAGRR